jgi:hypothetical protein
MAYLGRIFKSAGPLPYESKAADGSYLGAFERLDQAQQPFNAAKAGHVKFTAEVLGGGTVETWKVEDA